MNKRQGERIVVWLILRPTPPPPPPSTPSPHRPFFFTKVANENDSAYLEYKSPFQAGLYRMKEFALKGKKE